jgi:hypothetical protein
MVLEEVDAGLVHERKCGVVVCGGDRSFTLSMSKG